MSTDREAPCPAAPLLIILPSGLNVSGVTMWAVRLAGELASQGRVVGLLLQSEPPGQSRLDIPLDSRIRVLDRGDLAPLESCGGELGPYAAAYAEAARALAGVNRDAAPVVISPNLLGDCYGAAAAAAVANPELLRLVGWQHSDIAYDTAVLAHYGPLLSGVVGVSDAIMSRLAAAMPSRAPELLNIPYGVPLPARAAVRSADEPLRLVYTGRMEHAQKRIGALPLLSDALAERSIDHTLTLIGDGPAADEIDRAVGARSGRLMRIPAASPAQVEAQLDAAHAFVLASRYEGLSVSMLEAMARGCVPIVTRVASGATQAIRHGANGFIADAGPEASEEQAAAALAGSVQAFMKADRRAMARAAWSTVRERFSLAAHAERVATLIDRIAGEPSRAREWPTDRPLAFTGASGVGTVPADAAARFNAAMMGVRGGTIVLHGAGRHTQDLARAIADAAARSGVTIAGVCDDDRQRWGGSVGPWPIIAPAKAAATGATHVLISSWLHEGDIWSRRDMYEAQGLRVVRLYAPGASPRAHETSCAEAAHQTV